ncbi:MAG: MBL fold metallo-hydrolase [Firmicutes bacterium]|nr:MBL fold metallo-hydrolase [Bacillota bacterium]
MTQAATHLPTLKYLGHASVKIKTAEGTVVYIDPFAGDDYSEPADLILVTHGHGDHNNVDKVAKKPGCRIITHREAIKSGAYQAFTMADVHIRAVAAYNRNHKKDASVGYILEFDGIKLYHAGDTSKIKEMADLASENIAYALLPMDGVYNMGPEEASECAGLIKAKYYIPIHTGPNGVFSEANIAKFKAAGKIVVKPGEILDLKG